MANRKEKILVFRFSSMGDVAMTVPVLKEFSEQNPETELVIVSRKEYEPFFLGIPNSVFVGIDLNKYKGIWGLRKLASELALYKPTLLADLHNVLRTKILKFFLSLSIKKQATLDKGRTEKKALTRKSNKNLHPLRPMSERYADVFRSLGFSVTLSHQLTVINNKKENCIGIAPFAKYQEKMYPLDKMKAICLELAQKGKTVYLFGGGKEEINILSEWENSHPDVISLAGKLPLHKEMEFIQTLPLLISMDSANMHIASLVGTRVLSIWGATHPFAGFLGYGQNEKDVIQNELLNCRPCSIFGNKPCYRNDWACMHEIKESEIIKKIALSL